MGSTYKFVEATPASTYSYSYSRGRRPWLTEGSMAGNFMYVCERTVQVTQPREATRKCRFLSVCHSTPLQMSDERREPARTSHIHLMERKATTSYLCRDRQAIGAINAEDDPGHGQGDESHCGCVPSVLSAGDGGICDARCACCCQERAIALTGLDW